MTNPLRCAPVAALVALEVAPKSARTGRHARSVHVRHPLTIPSLAWCADPQPGPPLTIHRAAGSIVLDGDLSDAGWQGVEPDTTWFETNPGDNLEPKVGNAVYLTYDDQ